jgi:hypothetical protein
MSKTKSGQGFKDFDRGDYVDRYRTYRGSSTPSNLVERTYKGNGRTYRMHGTDTFGRAIFGKELGPKGHK